MPNILPFSKSDRVAAIFNDAGATNLAIGWLENATCTINPFMTGPALHLWEAKFPNSNNTKLETVLNSSNIILTGTGWGSKSEHDSREFAKRKKLLSIAVIDHWTNYSIRFTYEGTEILPDEIWVTDNFAREKASNIFPSVSVRLLPNLYLDGKVKAIQKLSAKANTRPKKTILYVLEPINVQWKGNNAPEFQALDYFTEHIKYLNLTDNPEIILRPHPSEPEDKYAKWCARNSHLDIKIQSHLSLEQQIAEADCVIGCETFALIIAADAGKNVICSIPPWGHSSRLRNPNIKLLSAIIDAAK